MDLELTQMTSLLGEKDLSGEQLDRISAQVTEITCQKEHILGYYTHALPRTGEQFNQIT
jgi:hypothetical protein